LQTFDDHELSGADAAFDNPHRTYTLANFYGQEGHLVAFHHGYLIGSLELGNSPLRHQQSAYSGFARRAHASELAGAQDIVGIGKSAYQLNAAGRDIHLPIRQKQSAFLRIERSVSQDEIKGRRIGWQLLLIVGVYS